MRTGAIAGAMRWLRSSHARFIGLIFLLEMLFGGLLLLSVVHLVERRIDAADRALATDLRDDLLAIGRGQGMAALASVVRERVAGRSDELILLADAAGRPVAGNLAGWPPVISVPSRWTKIDLYRVGVERPGRFGVIATALPGGGRLLSGHLIDSSTQITQSVEDALLTALFMALPLAAAGAWLVVHIIDRRVAGVTATAREVRAGDFARRVPLDGSGDSFDQLGATINAMLDRIETLVSELRLLTDSMAHDLRSPLTRLRARVDRAALLNDSDALQAEVEGIGREADALLAMLGTALEISRAEAGIGRDRFVAVELAAMLEDLVELYAPLVEEQGRAIDLSARLLPPLPVHRELLVRAVSNLIDNALKYGAGRIGVGLAERKGWVLVTVSDEGEGVEEGRQAEALRRFGRLDPARSATGAGLGLSLVVAVAELHGGGVALHNSSAEGGGSAEGAKKGFRVEIMLPRAGA